MIITPVTTSSEEGHRHLERLKDRFLSADVQCRDAVTSIIDNVRENRDMALLQFTRKFDSPDFSREQLRVTDQEIDQAHQTVSGDLQETLDLAIHRIRTFHEREKEESWITTREDGTIVGRLVIPVDSAGLYVPGGKGGRTPLVSSVLMNGIPAAIAGVKRRVMVTPPDENGLVNPALLVAAHKIGLTEIYKIGSAWAIAALALGTETIPRVDVIVGPGNQYVTEAKRQIAGRVRIDMIAGPSEVLIVADQSAKPEYIAADMLAQAEHDAMALAMLVTTSMELANQVVQELEAQLAALSRADIAQASLKYRGIILVADTTEEAITIANDIAAEHLELMIQHPYHWLTRIRHAGAIFLGDHSPEATGDYLAGPNHVLPTMGTARISSALGVETFIKKSSVISCSRQALANDAEHIKKIAELEGLTAHANSVAVRLNKR